MRKNIIFKVCVAMLAAMVMIACGKGKQQSGTSDDDTKTEVSASKSGKAKKSKKKSKDIKTKGRKKKKSILTPTSSGSPYEILLVAAEDDFHNGVVDSLYAVLTDDVLGVAQSEPSFKVVKITQNNFSKTLRMCRNVVVVKIDPSTYNKCRFKYSRDVYAAPQIIMTIQAPSASKFKDFVTDNRDAIVDFFNKAELNRACELLQEDYQPYIQEEVKKMFGCDFLYSAAAHSMNWRSGPSDSHILRVTFFCAQELNRKTERQAKAANTLTVFFILPPNPSGSFSALKPVIV